MLLENRHCLCEITMKEIVDARDLKTALKLQGPIMFPGHDNLLYSNKNAGNLL